MNWLAIKAVIIKELLAVMRDKKARITLIMPPLMQLLLFANAATLEVRHISVVYLDQDGGRYSRALTERVKGSPYFENVYQVQSLKGLENAINTQKALLALHIKSDFSQKLSQGQKGQVQILLDGRKSNASQIVQGYVMRIIETLNQDYQSENNKAFFTPPQRSVAIQFRSWFNPNLDYVFYTVPHLVGILSMVMGLIVTALSVAREREMGTFDQILVTPLSSVEILIGKMVPAMLIGVGESTLIMALAMMLYGIPFQGSLALFYVSLIVFMTSIIGIGLFISSISKTQQQATLGVFIFMMPTMLLSGFATPIDNMPAWLQPFTWLIPIRHLFAIIKGIFLKNMGFWAVMDHIWPMAVIALFTLTFATWMFKHKLE